jgi:hypothetical protein
VSVPTTDELQEAANAVAREFQWGLMSGQALAQAEAMVRHQLFPDHGDVDIKAQIGYVCNHEGPEGDCEWTLSESGKRCPFHGATTRGTKINLLCTVPLYGGVCEGTRRVDAGQGAWLI